MLRSETMVAVVEDERSSVEAALTRINQNDVRLVDLQFSDITGGAKALTIPVELLAATLRQGYRFDGSALTGLRQVELDLYLVPDPGTLVIFPESDEGGRRAQLSCSVLRRDGQPFAGDPRSVLERTLASAREAGFDYRVGIEVEFYLLPDDPGAPIRPHGAGYFDVGEDRVVATRDEVLTTLQQMGIGVGGAHHETGPGQEELDLLPADALRMADQLITARQVVRSVAQRRGLRATFMPKPMSDAPGSGMHIFQQFARYPDGGDALRVDQNELSMIGRQVIGGQLAHAPGMCLVVCPTVNSYKRLNAGHRAPRHATWAHVSQASLIRVPSLAEGEDTALEFRSPDPMANPYLSFAVALASALDGIRHGEEPPDALDESFVSYDDEELQRLGIPRLPGTLGEAIHAFTEDSTIHATVGDYVVDQLLTVKRAEWEDYRRQVSQWELARYGDA
jgi:glutamine synthetase